MFKIGSLLDRLFVSPSPSQDETDVEWGNDPLRHPDISRMDIRELGDLPFPGNRVRGKTANVETCCA